MTGRLEIPATHEPQVLDDFVVQVARRAAKEEASIVERRIRLLLQPKPRWWPEWLYRRLVGRLLMVEVTL